MPQLRLLYFNQTSFVLGLQCNARRACHYCVWGVKKTAAHVKLCGKQYHSWQPPNTKVGDSTTTN